MLNPGCLPFESSHRDLPDGRRLGRRADAHARKPQDGALCCETRSRFRLGEIESRDPNVKLSDEQIRRLHQYATEEMGYLAEILPTLYWRCTQDNTFLRAAVGFTAPQSASGTPAR